MKHEQQEHAKVFAEFQDMNDKIAAKLCTRPATMESPTSNFPIYSDDLSEARLKGAESVPNDTDDERCFTESFGSSNTSKSGPTPKRTKTETRRVLKRPSMAPKVSVNAKSSYGASSGYSSKSQRHALRNLGSASRNQSVLSPVKPPTPKLVRGHMASSAGNNSKENEDDVAQPFGRQSFDSSGIFSSTDEQRLAVLYDQDTRNDYGETTLDG